MNVNTVNIKTGFLVRLSILFLTACGDSEGGGNNPPAPPPTLYTIGGNVSGLSGTVVLQNNGADTLSLSLDGPFTFPTALTDTSAYNVTVLTQPVDRFCSVSNGVGAVSGANVPDVSVICAASAFTVGGTVSGLTGTVVLQNNSGDDLTKSTNESFTFSTPVADGSPYSVTVLTQPSGQGCGVEGGTGMISGANVTNVTVRCAALALFAGDMGGRGNVDGTGSAARFDFSQAVATDSAGNVYVADSNNQIIRKITPAGAVTTLAGTAGIFGNADGTGAAARFAAPSGVATDSADNVYVADSNNHTLRKITPAGVVTTLAGTVGTPGSTDSAGGTPSFNRPAGVATDSAGNVYVADTNNHTLRKITAAGVVSTLAGTAGISGSTDSADGTPSFNGPHGLATDSAGNVYVADTNNHTVRKITAAGVVTTFAGMGTPSFSQPSGVATDSAGNVYVADTSNHTIRKVTAAGVVSTLAGSGVRGSDNGAGDVARFDLPRGVAVDSAGNVFVADNGSNIIRKISPAAVVSTLAGAPEVTGSTNATGIAARFSAPVGLATDSAGNVYVADLNNHTIRKITPTGEVSTFAGTVGAPGSTDSANGTPSFRQPFGLATDDAGNVYVGDLGNHTIRKITPAGVVSTLAGTAGMPGSTDSAGGTPSFSGPHGVATDIAGNVYVADTINRTIRKITPAGVVSTLAGLAGATGSANGTGAAARFNFPFGVATDSAGNVYVADTVNHTIRKITPAGAVTTLAGGGFGSADGTGAAARFHSPQGIATDSVGNVYVTDYFNHSIRKITAAGVVTTVVGVAGVAGFGPGALPGQLGFPQSVATSGNSLYVTLYNGVAVVKDRP